MDKREGKPVYEFYGYALTEIIFEKEKIDSKAERIKIILSNGMFDEKEFIYQFKVIVFIKYKDVNESKIIFQAAFKINDIKWMKDCGESFETILFAGVFPFIREKVFAITNDSFDGIMIPTLDLRTADLKKGIIFSRKSN